MSSVVNTCLLVRVLLYLCVFNLASNIRSIGLMSISSSAGDRKRVAVTGARESSITTTPITLSERSITGLALIRIFVGYL